MTQSFPSSGEDGIFYIKLYINIAGFFYLRRRHELLQGFLSKAFSPVSNVIF